MGKIQLFPIGPKFYMEVGGDGLRLGKGFGGFGGSIEGSAEGLRVRDSLRIPWTPKIQLCPIGPKFYMEVGGDGLRLGKGFGGFGGSMEGSEGSGSPEDPLDPKNSTLSDWAQILHGGWG